MPRQVAHITRNTRRFPREPVVTPAPVKSLQLSIVALVLTVLAACGGGHSSTPDAGPPDAGGDGGTMGCGNGIVEPPEQCDDGNLVPGDGCEPDCTKTAAEEVQCETLTPPSSGVCEVTAGGASQLIKGDILTPGKIYRGGQVAIDATGTISCVGCDCAAQVPGATVITCAKGAVSPGLINDHDHITYTQNAPYTDTGERYEQRHDWRKGLRGHTKISAAGSASSDQKSWGELRQLLGGTTSLVGSGSAPGLVRNLDVASAEEGLGQKAVDYSTFPLDDSGGTQRDGDCNYGANADTEATIANDDSYVPHVAEGIDRVTRNEFLCTSSATFDTTAPGVSNDLTQKQTAFIHAVGLEPPDYELMASESTGLIWSPRSNITLYGNTAEVTVAARAGVLISLGTDWTPTGSINLLRELRCAASYNQTYLNGYFTDQELWRMVTVNAAEIAGDGGVLGVLAAGKVADIAIFDEASRDAYSAVVGADPADVALVMRGGKPLYGEAGVIAALTTDTCDTLTVCGAARRVCLQSEIGKSLSALQTANASSYGAIFCGTPDNEPTCVPSRPASVDGSTVYTGATSATDADGDGIPDAQDNCPDVFNPIRPLDGGKQADFDSDGVGDACDVCPTAANTTSCPSFNPSDADADGVSDSMDNCPGVYNPDQADADSDGKGDACDACPNAKNPGTSGCPTTIYDIKSGVTAIGANVALSNVLVTGHYTDGYFLQVKETDTGYQGSDNSGIFVYAPANTVASGDRVDVVSAVTADYFGEIQLNSAVVNVTSSGEAAPAPVAATSAEVGTGGTRAAALEGVLVKITNATVTDVAPAPGPGDTAPTNEFVVDGTLRVDDLLYLISPFPLVNQNFASVTGIVAYRNNNSKLEPQAAGDYVAGNPTITSFGPAQTYTRVGASGASTIPTPLTVTLVSAPATDTFVQVGSSDTNSLTVVGGGVTVPAGQTSAQVLVNGLAQAADVTLTASLNGSMGTSHLRVVAASEQPAVTSLTPNPAPVPPGGTISLTVTLDIPAPAGGSTVTIAVSPTNAGSAPATVTVPADQTEATFDYTDASTVTSATITATLGASMASTTVTVQTGPDHLVINELDYNQAGTDGSSFIEIYNGTGAPVSLTNLAVVLINGSGNSEYARFALSTAGASLADKQYLVIGNTTITGVVPQGVLTIDATGDFIQNGSPDGLAIIDTSSNTLVDAFCYGGAITAATITGFSGTVSLVEGTASSVVDTSDDLHSLVRDPNGSDTDDASVDWKLTSTKTPGADNIVTP